MNNIDKAVKVLQDGGIIIYPTDTVFGIGCRIDDEKAIKRLFKLKNRSEKQAVPVLVDSIEMAKRYAEIPRVVENRLIRHFWPGALTIILRCNREDISKLILGEGNTIGLRMSNHKIPLEIIKELGVPIVGTSANTHGKPSAIHLDELDPELLNSVDLVIPGEVKEGISSTIIDCTKDPWEILRQGSMKIEL